MTGLVIYASEENVFEGNTFAIAEGKLTRRLHEQLQVPFLVNRHNPSANGVVGRIEGNGQLGPYRLVPELNDPRNDAGRRDGHARFRKAYAFHQQPHRLHELRVVQERFAHPHEDDIHSLPLEIDATIVQYRADLPHNLPGCQVALHSQERCQTELAVHGATHLAGNADGGPLPFGISGFAPIDGFPAIALGHPHGLYSFTVGHGHEVADGAVRRLKAFLCSWQTDLYALALESGAKLLGQSRDRVQSSQPLRINRLKELAGAVFWL